MKNMGLCLFMIEGLDISDFIIQKNIVYVDGWTEGWAGGGGQRDW